MEKEKTETEKYAEMLMSMSTDLLMGKLDEETFKSTLSVAAKNLQYDSEVDTLKHIKRVNELLVDAATELLRRAKIHDDSKLGENEKPFFDKETAKLKKLTVNSPEYKESLKRLGKGLEHHYSNNSHHPEHYKNGINGMNLFDVIEMFFDWKAAGERHFDGCIYKSIEKQTERFNLSEQIVDIFTNTAKFLGWKPYDPKEDAWNF